jgi:hypothetical protein
MMDDGDECGAVDGIKIGRRNRNARRKLLVYQFVQYKPHII